MKSSAGSAVGVYDRIMRRASGMLVAPARRMSSRLITLMAAGESLSFSGLREARVTLRSARPCVALASRFGLRCHRPTALRWAD